MDISGSPNYIWERKLRRVQCDLKACVQLDYTSASNKKSQLQSGLAALHSKMEKEEITPLLISQEKDLSLNILKAARCEEEELRVKSRHLWLKGGDRNTTYFHKQTKARLCFNTIKELKDRDDKRMVE